MLKLLSIFVVGSMLLSGMAFAEEMASPAVGPNLAEPKEWASFVQNWAHRDPVPAAPAPSIWDVPEVKPAFLKTLGEKRLQQLVTGWGVDHPQVTFIENVDNRLAFSACKPKSGCSPSAILFIAADHGTVEVQACWDNVWLTADGGEQKLNAEDCQYRQKTNLSALFQAQQLTPVKTP